MELVGILAKFLRILCEVDFDVGDVTHLICSKHSKYSLLSNLHDSSSFEPDHVGVVGLGLVARETLAE